MSDYDSDDLMDTIYGKEEARDPMHGLGLVAKDFAKSKAMDRALVTRSRFSTGRTDIGPSYMHLL